MLPLAILHGQPVVGCICADGTFKTNCPAMRATASSAHASDCCAAESCARPQAEPPKHACCDQIEDQSHDAAGKQQPSAADRFAEKGCCRPAVESHVPPPLVSVVQVVDDHDVPAPVVLPATMCFPLAAATATGRFENDTGPSTTDLVITLRHLLI